MIGGADFEKRKQVILSHLAERRAATEGEAQRLRTELGELTRQEAVLRDEVATLDAILAAIPEPPKESEAPSLFAPAPKPTPLAPTIEPPKKRRRRKRTRREEILPKLREKFGSRAFTTEDVTDAVLEAEAGERRKAYFAAWSLVRDLAVDGLIEVVTEEGSGPLKKRTYRFKEGTKG